MKILLVGNYVFDRQQSMQRFAEMLLDGLSYLGHEVRLVQPKPLFGKLKPTNYGIGKYLGYIDKFLVFPKQLQNEARWADLVHVCDHSNGMYVSSLQNIPHLITCHDLLAVRGALGEDVACEASSTGRILQRWILTGLKQANMIVCDSTYTQKDVERLVGAKIPERNKLVLLGQNYFYNKLSSEEIKKRLSKILNVNHASCYLLHVGASHPRKNRDGVIRILHEIRDHWDGVVVFAGKPLSSELIELVHHLDLKDRVVEVIEPDNEGLEALYNGAYALLFPSRSEGFGWPIIEAQACGCPVVCSDRTSLPEVAGDAAIICPLEDENAFAEAILSLKNPLEKAALVEKGLEHIKQFTAERMCAQYIDIYEEILARMHTKKTYDFTLR
jgi:glycosyltransferase involved in cell wall biosynthesis